MTDLASRLADDLRALGVSPGDRVLTHSSFRAVVPRGEPGAPADVVAAIVAAVGPDGLAVFPTHTWEGNSPDRVAEFDVRATPSRAIGAIPEAARAWPGAVRSVHPTHSVVAIGARAAELVAGHEDCPTQTGAGTPYAKLAADGGRILLLGVDHERNTSIHGLEEDLDVPGALAEEVGLARLTDAGGRTFERPARYHSWRARRFMRIEPDLSAAGAQVIGRVGAAEARLVDAAVLRRIVAERLAEDPLFLFAEPEAPC